MKDPTVPEQGTANRRFDAVAWLRRYGTSLFLCALIVFFALENSRFLSLRNVTNILTEVSIYGIIAVGMTFVILTAGVDLAVGSLLAFAGMSGAFAMKALGMDSPSGWVVALAAATAVGTLVGYLQGKAVTFFSVPPFIVTLGGMTVWRGATLILNDGSPISGFDASYRWWGTGAIAGIPVPILLFGSIAAAGFVTERYTRYGRYIYAVGGNPEAARLNGLDVPAPIPSVCLCVGAGAGVSGFLLSARLGSGEAVGGIGYELRVIASVVIGGTSLSGGRGGIGRNDAGSLTVW